MGSPIWQERTPLLVLFLWVGFCCKRRRVAFSFWKTRTPSRKSWVWKVWARSRNWERLGTETRSFGRELQALPFAGGQSTYCGRLRNPFRTTMKPSETITFVGIYRGIIIPGFCRWCRMSSTHSMSPLCPAVVSIMFWASKPCLAARPSQ